MSAQSVSENKVTGYGVAPVIYALASMSDRKFPRLKLKFILVTKDGPVGENVKARSSSSKTTVSDKITAAPVAGKLSDLSKLYLLSILFRI